MNLPRFKPSWEHEEYVHQYLKRGGVAKRGDFDGDYERQYIGIMAQVLVADWLDLEWPKNNGWDGGYDLLWNEKKWDVKCKVTNVPHRSSYPHNLQAAQIHYCVDGYIFVVHNKKDNTYTMCGAITKGQLLNSAKYFPPGSKRPRSDGTSMVVKGKKGMYELKDEQLQRMR